MRTTIYALFDPRSPEIVRYVGKSRRPRARLRKHLKPTGRDLATHRGKWIAKLLAEGVAPAMLVLARVPAEREDEAERAMILRMRAAGHPLTNGSLGGEGGALTPEAQARATATMRARGIRPPPMTPEQRLATNAKLSALRSDPAHNPMMRPEVRAKNAASQRRRHEALGHVAPPPRLKRGTPEYYAMVRERNRRSDTPETRAAIARALKGRPKPSR